MFEKYSGGTLVPCGTYLNTNEWAFHVVPREGECLECEGATYYRVPLLLVMALAPVLGLAFILFLPVAVPAVLIYGVARRIAMFMHPRRPISLDRRGRW